MIEVGEYVRTDKGTIAKIEDVEWDLLYRITTMKPIYKHWVSKNQCYTEEVIKHSKNIIDLIEVGDYVNGDIVVPIDYNEDEQGNYFNVLGVMDIDDDYAYPIELSVINIRTIVTKEQMAQMEYKVKE